VEKSRTSGCRVRNGSVSSYRSHSSPTFLDLAILGSCLMNNTSGFSSIGRVLYVAFQSPPNMIGKLDQSFNVALIKLNVALIKLVRNDRN
jgi:hypothetical protein